MKEMSRTPLEVKVPDTIQTCKQPYPYIIGESAAEFDEYSQIVKVPKEGGLAKVWIKQIRVHWMHSMPLQDAKYNLVRPEMKYKAQGQTA